MRDAVDLLAIPHDQFHELVLIQQLIHEPRLLGGFPLEETVIEEFFDVLFAFPPGFRDLLDVVVVQACVDRVEHLSVGRGQFIVGEHVVGGLVFPHVFDLGLHPQLVQRLFDKGDVAADPVDDEESLGMEHDLVTGGGQVVFLVEFNGLFDVSVGFLPGCAEIQDQVPDLIDLGPVTHQVTHAQDHGRDPAVDLRLAQVGPDIIHG